MTDVIHFGIEIAILFYMVLIYRRLRVLRAQLASRTWR